MGDSLTDPKSHGGIYLEVLKERCPKSTFVSFGVGGNMVNMMRKRFLRDVYGEVQADAAAPSTNTNAPSAPSATSSVAAPAPSANATPKWTDVILLGGLGDILSNETAGRNARLINGDLRLMAELARARGARVIAMTLPPWGGFKGYDGARAAITREVNAWIRASGPKEKEKGDVFDAVFEPGPSLTCGDPDKLCPELAFKDRLHWSEAGQRAVGAALYEAQFRGCE